MKGSRDPLGLLLSGPEQWALETPISNEIKTIFEEIGGHSVRNVFKLLSIELSGPGRCYVETQAVGFNNLKGIGASLVKMAGEFCDLFWLNSLTIFEVFNECE